MPHGDVLMRDFMINAYGYEKLTGQKRRETSELINDIAQYKAQAVLETSAKVLLKLYSTGFSNQDTQIRLVRDIFNYEPELRKTLLANLQENPSEPWSVFSYQPLMLIMKLSLLNCKHSEGSDINEDKVLNYGKWLLEATDIILGSEEEARSLGSEELREFLVRQHFFMFTDQIPYMVARFTKILEVLVKNEQFEVLRYFELATGLHDAKEYIQFCFYLLVNWINKTTKEPNITSEWIQCKNKYFEQTKLTTDEIDRVLKLLIVDNEQFKEMHREGVESVLGGEDYLADNFLVFQKRPLIKFNDSCFICSHPKYLMEKLYVGLYWSIENYLLKSNLTAERKVLPVVWGAAFEKYIDDCFRSGFGSDYYKVGVVSNVERNDGILNTPSAIYFIETKAPHFTLKAKYTGEKSEMQKTLNQLFSREKGYGQITRNIKDLRRLKWSLPFDRDNKPIIPLIITDEPLPMDALNRKMYLDYSKEKEAFYTSKKVFPFIILNVEEIEMLDAIAQKDIKHAQNLLFDYASIYTVKPNDRGLIESLSFKNYLHLLNNNTPNNERLFSIFNDFAKEATRRAFFEELEESSSDE